MGYKRRTDNLIIKFMEKIGNITKVVANFVVDDNVITDYWLTKSFEDGDVITENFNSVHLMMEEWCYLMLLGYTCTTNVDKG